MSIPEACGLWIEQRVKDEIEQKGETGASLREIGRKVAAEVEKYFETKVSPDAIRIKAGRMGGTNVPEKSSAENYIEKSDNNGDNGDIPRAENIIETIDRLTPKLGSVRRAIQEVADEVGKSEDAIKKQYQREKKKEEQLPTSRYVVLLSAWIGSSKKEKIKFYNEIIIKWEVENGKEISNK